MQIRYRFKWAARLDRTIGLSQPIDFFDEQVACSVRKNDREKEDTAFVHPAIVRHGTSYRHGYGGHGARAPLPTLQILAAIVCGCGSI